MKVTGILLLIVFCSFPLKGQDFHLSQFYFSPQTLNPANTGNFDGEWRLTNNMRRQWGEISPYSTIVIGFEHQISIKKQHFAGGIMLLNDRSNYANMNINGAYISAAYIKRFNGHQLRLGLQGGYVNKHFPKENLSFPDQYDITQGHFNSDLGTQEPNFREEMSYMDINAGIGWKKRLGFLTPQLGAALFHANRPNGSFLKDNSTLPFRQVYNGTIKIEPSNSFYLTPRFLYMQQNNVSEYVAGISGAFMIEEHIPERSIFVGGYLRNGVQNFDAMILTGGIKYDQWTLGLSYDINMSGLKTANSNPSGLEISITYQSISSTIEKITVPCERF